MSRDTYPPIERAADALESIAASLATLAKAFEKDKAPAESYRERLADLSGDDDREGGWPR